MADKDTQTALTEIRDETRKNRQEASDFLDAAKTERAAIENTARDIAQQTSRNNGALAEIETQRKNLEIERQEFAEKVAAFETRNTAVNDEHAARDAALCDRAEKLAAKEDDLEKSLANFVIVKSRFDDMVAATRKIWG
ncbi:MAG: hypothetical protein ABIO35_08280 [Nitrobacter sp.]